MKQWGWYICRYGGHPEHEVCEGGYETKQEAVDANSSGPYKGYSGSGLRVVIHYHGPNPSAVNSKAGENEQ